MVQDTKSNGINVVMESLWLDTVWAATVVEEVQVGWKGHIDNMISYIDKSWLTKYVSMILVIDWFQWALAVAVRERRENKTIS